MLDWRKAIDAHLEGLAEDLRAIRRHLHAHPEPSREELNTTRFLASRLDGAGIPYRVIASGRGIVAGPALHDEARGVALRADMDALRIADEKQVAYRSIRAGVMHACGHDAHSTMVLGAALALEAARPSWPWPVPWRALFQPAEEVAEGAAEMVAEGAVDGISAIVALHVAPDLPVGRVGVRLGVMTAFCQEIDVIVRGEGGHAARPHLAIDPIAAAAQFLTLIYQSLPRSVDSRDPSVVTFGAIAGGTSGNVIPDKVVLRGTLRTMGKATATRLRDRLTLIALGVEQATGARIELSFGHETDAVVNDPAVTDKCIHAAEDVVGRDGVERLALPSMGGEDFSGYLDRVPGCLLRLGVAGHEGWPALHSPEFDIDERALVLGARILARSAVLLAAEPRREN